MTTRAPAWLSAFWRAGGVLAVVRTVLLLALSVLILTVLDIGGMKGVLWANGLWHGLTACGGFLARMLALPACVSG